MFFGYVWLCLCDGTLPQTWPTDTITTHIYTYTRPSTLTPSTRPYTLTIRLGFVMPPPVRRMPSRRMNSGRGWHNSLKVQTGQSHYPTY